MKSPVPTITDDILAEIESEFRASGPRPAGQVAASNAATLSMIRRLRESEARHTLERFAKEAGV